MTRSQQFIEKYKKVLVSGAAFYNPDTTLMPAEKFETAKCKMLLILPTPLINKTVSSTVAAINDYIITHCPDTFLDVAYMPEPEDVKHYDKFNLPYAIGHITHLDPSHFDVIGFSISVIHEIVATPVIINTFSRCDKPIPLFWSQRKDLPLAECPILYAGGITAVCGESMFGKVNTGSSIEQAYLDFLYLGECDQTDILIKRLISAKESGTVTRSQSDHDVVGKPHEDIPDFQSELSVKTVQDYVESLFDMTEIYQPQVYEVEYNNHNQIIKNIKINPKARDFVTPYYPHKLPYDLGIGRAVIQANGDACGKVHIQVSNGCSAAGSCSFKVAKGTRIWTNKGLVKIEDCDTNEIHGLRLEHSKGVCKQSSSTAFRFVTSDGHELIADLSHRFLVVEHDNFVEKSGDSLKPGDVILRALGGTFGNAFSDSEFADLLGFLHGDGCFDVKHNRVKIYMSSEELLHYEPLFRRYFPSNYRTRVHYRSETTTIYVIESNISSCVYDVDLAPVHCLDLYVPEFIFTGTKEVICSYLSGIFQADGWITKEIGLTSISKRYVQDISLLLSYVGIDSTIRCNEYFSRHIVEGHKISYFILVPKPFHDKFSELINTPVKHVSDVHIGNRTKSNLFNTSEIQKRCRRLFPSRDSVRAAKIGGFFESTRHRISDSKFRLAFQYGLFEEGRPSYYVASGRFVTDTIASVECLDYTVEMYDVLSTDSSYCVYGSWLTHNCSEGNYSGGWVEQDPEIIKKLMREAKKYSAAYTFKPFSFNSNYLKDYKGQLAEWIKMYPKVTFNNMRMEELGRDVDAMKIMKLLGFDRIAAPLEGLSPRLQNNLLNKCLSQEAMDNFMDYMVHAHMIDMKVGTIYTGYEEDEDYQWFLDYIKSFKKRAAEEGGTFPVRLKACLTAEALTPIPGKGLVRNCNFEIGPVAGYVDSSITELKPQGVCRCLKLVTKDGTEITGTYEHPLLVDPRNPHLTKSYKFLKDLKPGDIVYGRLGTECYGSCGTLHLGPSRFKPEEDIELTPILAKALGWYMGDGYLNVYDKFKCFGFCFNEEEVEIKDEIIKAMGSVGISSHPHDQGAKKMSAIRCYEARFGRMLNEKFGHTAYGKKIPDEILQSPFEVQREFIRYWFAADGTVSVPDKNGQTRVHLCSVNKEVLRTLKVMLANMGIHTSLTGHRTYCDGKEFYAYNLEVRGAWVEAFATKIGIAGVKGTKIKWRKRKVNKFIVQGFVRFDVAEVSQAPDEETYGITVNNGTYVTNGMVSHNTPLVHYPLTPMEYLERRSTFKSYSGERWLTDEWYDKFWDERISFKVNGFKYSTLIEQTFLDLGRELSQLLYNHFIKDCVPIHSTRSCATDEYIQAIKDMIDEDYYFKDREPEHYISPCHRIHIELMGSYIPRARRLVRLNKQGKVLENEPDTRCLRTYVGAPTKCYHTCISNEPLLIYKDVTMDEEGNLHGDSYPLTGCQRCVSNEERKGRLTRDASFTKNSEDIIAARRIPQVQKIRFLINRLPDYDLLNPNNTAYTFVTKFLQASDNLLDSFHSIVNHNMYGQSGVDYKDYQSGVQIVDTIWSKNVIKEVKSLIPEVNKHLKSTQVTDAIEILRDEKFRPDDLNFYTFESTIPRELFDAAQHSYKGQIKVEESSRGFALVEKTDTALFPPVVASINGKTVGCFAIPLKYNPNIFLSSYISQARKTSEEGIISTTTVKCNLTMRETYAACKNCGKESALISIASGKPMPFGKECLCKAILTQYIKSV